jgi:hypothetical protein
LSTGPSTCAHTHANSAITVNSLEFSIRNAVAIRTEKSKQPNVIDHAIEFALVPAQSTAFEMLCIVMAPEVPHPRRIVEITIYQT